MSAPVYLVRGNDPTLRGNAVAQLVTEMVANIRSLEAGGRLLEEVDLARGY